MGVRAVYAQQRANFAVDYNGDGVIDIWHNKGDAIASVANYFKANGWQYRAPVLL